MNYISLNGDAGSDKANATDMPPLNPPHVKIGIAFSSNVFLYLKTEMGMATEINLASNTIKMDTPQPKQC